LSELATTTDPDSDEPIERLVEALEGKRDLLVALRAITEADAASLATDKWTTWRATLVDNLFQRAKPHMKVRS
jgi:[protein-PII] uridylyltransferase